MDSLNELKTSPHRRLNALNGEWVAVSPHRTQRPWQGQVERSPALERKPYDPTCYLCPGNSRAGGHKNPDYSGTFVFDNDYAALLPDTPQREVNEKGLIVASAERGICRVICFLPQHDLTLARMQAADIRRVIDVWAEQYLEIGSRDFIRHVQIFENRGEMMGASNPHPHCQVWATSTVPNEPSKELATQTQWREAKGACLLCDYLRIELRARERIVADNEHFAVLVPFWAVWPFETLVLPKRHMASMDAASDAERDSLADILKRITTRYDNVFETLFPYSMGFHQKPVDGRDHPEWHLHAHFYPPLLRSATVRKFMVGFEMLGSPQRDITPESAAERLRTSSERHFAPLD
jgi:UDPglucose--hexose-1-phosphate uridylyltransferase